MLGALCLSLAIPVRATTITVQEVGVSPTEIATISVPGFYTGGVYAGVNNLIVDGVPTNGFCIDPFHFSLSSSPGYQFVALANAPKPPGTMGTAGAAEISKLWAMTYSPTITAPEAAGLQIAIWEIVGGSNFSVIGNDYGASQLLTDVQSYTGPSAHLIALSGPGQDYVIAVPDNAKSVTLLLIALFGIALVKWQTVGTKGLSDQNNIGRKLVLEILSKRDHIKIPTGVVESVQNNCAYVNFKAPIIRGKCRFLA